MKKILVILLVTVFTATVIHAQKPEIITSSKKGWHKIGEADVNFKMDKDEFLVLGNDKFRSIRLKVQDAPIHISDMEVFYDKGGKQDVSLRSDFKAGSSSRIITLRNSRAGLKKVAFVYHTIRNSKAEKGHIELWGLK